MGDSAAVVSITPRQRRVETIFRKRGISIAGWAILGVQVRSGERGSDQHQCRWLFLVPCSTC